VSNHGNLSAMATQTKGNTLRFYLRDEELAALAKLTETLEISQTEIMGRIMTAGIRAIREAGNRMPLPLKFQIVDRLPEKDSSPARLKR
jgi:hypothetical protein